MAELLRVQNLSHHYYSHSGWLGRKRVEAVKHVSFTLEPSETIAILGESGSGKSTLAKILSGITKPSSGDIFVNGEGLTFGDYQRRCRLIRMIFQDPHTSLNPNTTIGRILEAPLLLNTEHDKQKRQKIIDEVLENVGLLRDHSEFYPSMLSSAQQQRLSLARALILNPKVIVSDGGIAAQDISLRAQMANIMLEQQRRFKLSYVIVTNDLDLVQHLADKVMLMHQGEAVEYCDNQTFFENPAHELSKRLLRSYNSRNEFSY